MIKNFVFDMGNVIIQWNPTYIVSQYVKDKKEIEYLVKEVFQSKEWQEYDHGTIERKDVIKNINLRLDNQYHALVKEMIYHWYLHCPTIKGMIPIIKELKEKGYGIYLLSNTNIHFEEYKQSIETFTYFDGFYISAKTKLIKPNIEIFEDFSKTFDLPMEECIFIDDIQDNIKGAMQAGMQGYHFTGDIERFKEYIKKESF